MRVFLGYAGSLLPLCVLYWTGLFYCLKRLYLTLLYYTTYYTGYDVVCYAVLALF